MRVELDNGQMQVWHSDTQPIEYLKPKYHARQFLSKLFDI